MKSEEELKNIARQIFDLELKCQNGIDVPQNMAKIEQLKYSITCPHQVSEELYTSDSKQISFL